jgi:DNA recombination-mediator protein A/DprA/Smf-like nucleotide binding protein involved in DNA uptake
VNEFGGAEAAIEALPMLSRRGGPHPVHSPLHEEEAEAELEAAEYLGANLVAIGEPGYPPALAQVDAPPPLLYVKGRLDLADIPIVAIVGARNGSAVEQKFTRGLATGAKPRGYRRADPQYRRRNTEGSYRPARARPRGQAATPWAATRLPDRGLTDGSLSRELSFRCWLLRGRR